MSGPHPRPAASSRGDLVFRGLCQSAGVFVLALAAALVAVLVYKAWPVLSEPGKYRLLTRDAAGRTLDERDIQVAKP